MIQSLLLLLAAIVALFLPVVAQHKIHVAQKSEKACVAEWRAKKAANKLKGMTQTAYMEQCRNPAATAQTAPAPSPATSPSTNGAATPLHKPARISARVETRHMRDRHGRGRARLRMKTPPNATASAD